VKVQTNLARFKIDLQNLRKGIQYLKTEQKDLATKPIQQILSLCKAVLQFSVVLFIFALVDLFTSEWIVETNKEYDGSKSVPHFIVKILVVLLSQVCILNDKIGVH
jgi:hypothetical protein